VRRRVNFLVTSSRYKRNKGPRLSSSRFHFPFSPTAGGKRNGKRTSNSVKISPSNIAKTLSLVSIRLPSLCPPTPIISRSEYKVVMSRVLSKESNKIIESNEVTGCGQQNP